jgi:hypothetical protein
MITAEKVNKLIKLQPNQLDQALITQGYTGFERVMACEFLGITNSGDFCYKITYRSMDQGTWDYGKVFVNINETGQVVADY